MAARNCRYDVWLVGENYERECGNEQYHTDGNDNCGHDLSFRGMVNQKPWGIASGLLHLGHVRGFGLA